MPISLYLSTSIQVLLASAIVFLIPSLILGRRLVNLPVPVLSLGILGFYSFATHLCSPWLSPPVQILLAWCIIVLIARKKILSGRIRDWIPSLPTLFTCFYCFLLFIFRWEPPGTDPIKWGSFARLFLETGSLPGDTFPLSAIRDIRGLNLGLPILISFLTKLGTGYWERTINFTECFSLFIFIFSLSLALQTWVARKYSQWAAFLALVLFTNPQQYLNWGGTPTLIGLSFGFLVLFTLNHIEQLSRLERIAMGFVFAFTAYAHPIGVYVSLLVCLPLFVFLLSRLKKESLISFIEIVCWSAVFFLPFLRMWGFQASHDEILGVWEWQKKMSPYFAREDHAFLSNLIAQVSSYLWSTSFHFVFILFVLLAISDKKRERTWIIISTLLLIFALVANVRVWLLPLSFLIYPERVATLGVFPMGLTLAWWSEKAWGKRSKWKWLSLLFVALGVRQFNQRLLPTLSQTLFTQEKRTVIEEVASSVPPSDCVHISQSEIGLWIPVISFRCTVPYHVLSESVQDEQKELLTRPIRWRLLVDGNGAKLEKVLP